MMNLLQTRIIDPVLSAHAYGFHHPERVGGILFPRAEVPTRGGHVLEFGKESFQRYNARRAPGAHTARINFGYVGKRYELQQDSLDVQVPREMSDEAKAVPDVDMGLRATDLVMTSLTLALELEQAALALNEAHYAATHKLDLSAGVKWSNPDGDPVQDIEAAKEAVRRGTGKYPNAMVLGPTVGGALCNNPKILERFKYTSGGGITEAQLAQLFRLERVAIGTAVWATEGGEFVDVWGNSAVLAYAPQKAPGQPGRVEEPSYGYTYTLKGHPFVEIPRWDGDTKSWIYGATFDRLPVLTGITAGYLIRNAA